jgi:iron-sulfur cluster repair protein YtfE (RIC family)
MRHLGAPVTKAALRKTYADLALMEEILRGSGLDWTVIRPPRLTGKPLTGSYRTAFGQNLRRGLFISRAPTSPTSCSACSSSPKRSIGLSESQIDQEERTVTAKDTADRAAEAIDFTMMYATHDAFRRDLGRLTAASAAGTADAPGVRAGWENFKAQLLLHHSVEDSDLWPRVRRAAAGRPSSLALLDEMEAEHARIDPLLAAVDAALANPAGNLAAHVAALTSALGRHLKHEEDAALPLIQAVCTSADWRAFTGEMRRRQGLKGAAIYVPWILDGAAPAGRQRFLAALPAPVRVINRLVLEPRFRQRGLWKA